MPSPPHDYSVALASILEQLRAAELAHARTAAEHQATREELARYRLHAERLARLEARIERCEERERRAAELEARLRALEGRPQDSAELSARVTTLEASPADAPEVLARITALEARAETARFGWGQVVAWVSIVVGTAGVLVSLVAWAWGLIAAKK